MCVSLVAQALLKVLPGDPQITTASLDAILMFHKYSVKVLTLSCLREIKLMLTPIQLQSCNYWLHKWLKYQKSNSNVKCNKHIGQVAFAAFIRTGLHAMRNHHVEILVVLRVLCFIGAQQGAQRGDAHLVLVQGEPGAVAVVAVAPNGATLLIWGVGPHTVHLGVHRVCRVVRLQAQLASSTIRRRLAA